MQELDRYIDKIKKLPPAPKIIPELLHLLRQSDIDAGKIVRLITVDIGLTSSVLALANSAQFGGLTPAATLHEAVTRLGFQQVFRLVITITGSRALGPAQEGYGLNTGELWKHSVSTAVAAQLIASETGDDPNLAFTAGLLHDLGKIVLSEGLANKEPELFSAEAQDGISQIDLEKKLLGVQHGEIGGRLLQRWRFPESLVNAVWYHHQPAGARPHQRLAALVFLGNIVAYSIGHGYGHNAFAIRARSEVFEILGTTPEIMSTTIMKTFDNLQMVEGLFGAAA